MQARFLTLCTAALVLAAPAAVLADQAAPTQLSASLKGADEVGGGDSDGTGSFTARIEKNSLCYTLSSANIDEATMAHIHKGAVGANGPIFIGLPDIDPGEHCEDIDADRLDQLKSNPGNFYVNIHNGDFPGGAVRGQIAKN